VTGVPNYVGILDGSDDVWGVRIPDVPGCHGGGPTPEAALADAISALREVAAYYVERDIPVPAARGMAEVIADEEAEYDPTRESLVMIPLILDRGRSVKASISLDAGLLEAIDEEARRRGLTRSAFLVSAALDKIEGMTGGADYRARGFSDVASAPEPQRGRRKARRN
jgi:predicted RNase H-like HicB family nuclease